MPDYMKLVKKDDLGYRQVYFGYGSSDGVTIENLSGTHIRVQATFDSGMLLTEVEVTIKDFLNALGITKEDLD